MFARLTALLRPKPPASTLPAPLWQQDTSQVPARFAHLRTGRGNVLVPGEGYVGMQRAPDMVAPLVAILPDANRAVAFLVAPDLSPIQVHDDGVRAMAVSAFVMPEAGSDGMRLRRPLSPDRFLGVTPEGAGGPNGCVVFNTLGGGELGRFWTLPMDPRLLVPGVHAAAAELCAAVARPVVAEKVLAQIRQGGLRAGLVEAVLRVMAVDELAAFAQLLMEDGAARRLLSELLGDDAWFARVLPELADWRADRRPVAGYRLHSPVSDEFSGDGLLGYGQVRAGMALTGLARASVRPRHGACLLAAARDEGPYLLEWLAYHFGIGFEHAFIYTNDNRDQSEALLGALADAGAVTLVHNAVGSHFGAQHKAFGHALSLLPQILDYRWCAALDLDEYLGFDAALFGGIDDYLAWQESQNVDAIALCWQLFAASRGDVWRDEFTPARFTRREPGTHFLVKSVFRPQKFWASQAHFPHSTLGAPFVYRTEAGTLHHHAGERERPPAHAGQPSAQRAWVNHYVLRSAPEALWKLARGHGDWMEGSVHLGAKQIELSRFVGRTFVNLADKADLVEDRRILACTQGMDAALARLRALPGVAAIEARIKEDFGESLNAIARAFVGRGAEPGEPRELAAFRGVVEKLLRAA